MNPKFNIGKLGESIACKYLIRKDYEIVDTNYRRKFGEIDVIAKSKEGILVFCEVKTITSTKSRSERIGPEDNATFQKLNKMKKIAQFYAAQNPDLILEEQGWRIDLIAVELKSDILGHKTIKHIEHYENCV